MIWNTVKRKDFHRATPCGMRLMNKAPWQNNWTLAKTRRKWYRAWMDEGRKRVLTIVAGILVARHIKTTDDLFDSRPTPRTESLVSVAVQWADRIMRKVDNVFPGKN
jgi:hypothetical protein